MESGERAIGARRPVALIKDSGATTGDASRPRSITTLRPETMRQCQPRIKAASRQMLFIAGNPQMHVARRPNFQAGIEFRSPGRVPIARRGSPSGVVKIGARCRSQSGTKFGKYRSLFGGAADEICRSAGNILNRIHRCAGARSRRLNGAAPGRAIQPTAGRRRDPQEVSRAATSKTAPAPNSATNAAVAHLRHRAGQHTLVSPARQGRRSRTAQRRAGHRPQAPGHGNSAHNAAAQSDATAAIVACTAISIVTCHTPRRRPSGVITAPYSPIA